MEDKALATLRTLFERRKLATETISLSTDLKDAANVYTIGSALVIFSQKDKMLDRDVNTYLKYAAENKYTNGIVIVSLSKPSENVLNSIKAHAKEGILFFHIRELQMDITTHRMSVPHRILSPEEAKVVLDKNRVLKPEDQLPWIDSQDIQARLIGAVPGDIIEITRHSDTVGKCVYYRYCVADVNVA